MEVDVRLLGRPPRFAGEGKANNIFDEPPDGEQHVKPGIGSALTRDEGILVLEREGPQADLMALMCVLSLCEQPADVCILASYGHCVLKLKVRPIAGTARVTIGMADVRYLILSVVMLVVNGHEVTF